MNKQLLIEINPFKGESLMEIKNVPFCMVNWSAIETSKYKGKTRETLWQKQEVFGFGWYSMVKVIMQITGAVVAMFCLFLKEIWRQSIKTGSGFKLTHGTSYQVASDDENPHRSFTTSGATLFIVD